MNTHDTSTITSPQRRRWLARAVLAAPLGLGLVGALGGTASAWAAAPQPYTAALLEQLSQEGRPVVLEVAAPWCSTCRAQKPIIERLSRQAPYADVAVLTVDYDSEKPLLKQLRVSAQSTLIAMRSGKEIARSVGDTTVAGIEGIFRRALP